jgi:hypothetical protein
VAVTVTEDDPAVVGVPVMAPVPELIESPVGSPVADHVEMVAVDDESVAELDSVEMGPPDRLDWLPGLATDTVLVTVQLKVACPEKPALSVAVTVTEDDPAVVGVPVMAPVPELMESPAGSPVAVYEVMVAVDEESLAPADTVGIAAPDTLDWLPGLFTVTVLVMVQVNAVLLASVWESVTVTVGE